MSDDLIIKQALPEKRINKIKVSSAEIVVSGTKDKLYYEIKYSDLSDNEIHIGYGSYDLEIVFEYLEKYFEIVNEEDKFDQVQDCHSDDLISRRMIKAKIEMIRNCWAVSPYVSDAKMKLYSNIFNVVLREISDCPIAFDKEKVIEELKEMATHSASCKNQCEFGSTEYFDYMGAEVAYKTTIEIVEKGGIEIGLPQSHWL